MNYGGIFDFESKESILAELRKESIASDFWNDSNKASSTLKKISLIEKELELWQDFERRHGDLEVLFEFAESDEVGALYREMEEEALAAFKKIGVDDKDIKFRRTIDMRYIGQFHEVEVDVEGGEFTQESLLNAAEAFGAKHEDLFTFSMPWKGVELLTLRVKATTPNAPFKLPEIPSGGPDAAAAKKRLRQCYFGNGFIEVQVYDGDRLAADNAISGPAIIEEATTTVVIPESYDCLVNSNKNYVLTRKAGTQEI
jgi:N-methylhydantoinase A